MLQWYRKTPRAATLRAAPEQRVEAARKCPDVGLASFCFSGLAGCNLLMPWKLSRTELIVTEAQWARRGGVAEALEGVGDRVRGGW